MSRVLVVGVTDLTGILVIQTLLRQEGPTVKVLVQTKETLQQLLQQQKEQQQEGGGEGSDLETMLDKYKDRLSVTEASIFDRTDEQLRELCHDCQAIVCCHVPLLGVQDIFGQHVRYLVTETTRRFTTVMTKECKYILQSSEGVADPRIDPVPNLPDRVALSLIRTLVPPHADQEQAAWYLVEHVHDIHHWCVVRPTDLITAEVSDYELLDCQKIESLFGSRGTATRANVADFIAELITNAETWGRYNHKMPVLYDKKQEPASTTTEGMEEGMDRE